MLKILPKILTIFFLAIFIFQLISLIFLFALPQVSLAATATFKPQVDIGTNFVTTKTYTPDGTTKMIGEYIRAIYKYAIGIVGILAAVVLMIGGILWIVAGGNATAIGEAKAWIGASLTGLLLALVSYLILATVNPALVDFKVTPVQTVTEIKMTEQVKNMLDEESRCIGSYADSNFSGTIIRGKEESAAQIDCNLACTDKTTNITNIAVFQSLKSSNGWCCICKPGTTASVGSNCQGVANGTPCEAVNKGFCYDNNCTSEKGVAGEYCGSAGSGGICQYIQSWGLASLSPTLCPYNFHQVLGGRSCSGLSLVCCANN